MPCESSVGQCLEPMGNTEGLTVCCDPYATSFAFPKVDTFGRDGCFIEIHNETNDFEFEKAHGRWCGFGCTGSSGDLSPCSDNPIGDHAALMNGQRWLAAPRDGSAAARDARGLLHDLRSNEYHRVGSRIAYEHAPCYLADGQECLSADSCQCWGDNTTWRFGTCESDPSIGVGGLLPGPQPSGQLRIGYRWPPDSPIDITSLNGQNIWYCRRFADTRLFGNTSVPHLETMAPTVGGGGVVEPLLGPILINDNDCAPNYLIYCAAVVPSAQGECETSMRAELTRRGVDPQVTPSYYDGPAQHRYDAITVTPINPGLALPDNADARIAASVALKNRILAWVWGRTIGGISFDRLDHQRIRFGNGALGSYQRRVDGISEPIMPVHGRTVMGNCAIEGHIVARSVSMDAQIVIEALKIAEVLGEQLRRWAEPHVRFIAVIETAIEVIPAQCVVSRMWHPDGDLEYRVDNGPREPIVDPPVDSIEWFDDSDRPVYIPSVVEWRGLIGGASIPSSRDLRIELATGPSADKCEAIARRFSSSEAPLVVKAWPSRNDEPRETVYTGAVRLGFVP